MKKLSVASFATCILILPTFSPSPSHADSTISDKRIRFRQMQTILSQRPISEDPLGDLGSREDEETGRLAIYSHPANQARSAALVAEGRARGINVEVVDPGYGMSNIRSLVDALAAEKESLKERGFSIAAVKWLDTDGASVVVRLRTPERIAPEKVSDTHSMIESAANAASIQVQIVDVSTGPVPTSRSTDTPRFYAGGMMTGCSNSWGVLYKGSYRTMTARHCKGTPYFAWDNASTTYGYHLVVEGETATQLLTGGGRGREFIGSYSSSETRAVARSSWVGARSEICSSGGMSGEHCSTFVEEIGNYDDGAGYSFYGAIASRKDGTLSVAQGDSGGPVHVYDGTGKVNAIGVIQAGDNEVSCSGVRASTRCFRRIYFSKASLTVSTLGASLVTE